MPKVTEKHKQDRRQQIVDAAMDCFLRNGFHQTSMRDICKEVGLSIGAIYLHFKSKEEIIEAVWQIGWNARKEQFEVAMRVGSSMDGLQLLSDDFALRFRQPVPVKSWQLYPLLLEEAARNPRFRQNIMQSWEQTENFFVQMIQQGIKQGAMKSDIDARIIGRLWAAVLDGIILQKIMDPQQDVNQVVQFLRALLKSRFSPDGRQK